MTKVAWDKPNQCVAQLLVVDGIEFLAAVHRSSTQQPGAHLLEPLGVSHCSRGVVAHASPPRDRVACGGAGYPLLTSRVK